MVAFFARPRRVNWHGDRLCGCERRLLWGANDPFALALVQAGFFAYIAGSASVFISEYALSPTQCSLLFGVNALGLLFAAMLIIYLASGHAHLFVLSAGLFVTVSLLGFIMPTGSQLALMQQREYAGTASALMGAMQVRFW